MPTWQTIVVGFAALSVVFGVVLVLRAVSQPFPAAIRRSMLFAGIGSILAGASRVLPEAFDLDFWVLMVGVGLILHASSSMMRSSRSAGAS
jgi:hypothetical protein